MFFEKKGPVWETLRELEARFSEAGIPYVVIGGLALNAHKFSRQTIDVDVCIRQEDLARFREQFAGKVYENVQGRSRRFRDPATEVTFDVLVSGHIAGRRDKNPEVRFPDPSEAVEVEGLRTVTIERLIGLKLVTWRRKDWADVIALIRENKLNEAFAQKLPAFLSAAYLQCYDEMQEEDRYDQELDRS